MMQKKVLLLLMTAAISLTSFSQPTYAVTDPEKKYKEAKEYFANEQYMLAYPLLSELKTLNPGNTSNDHGYMTDDVNYYYIICELKLQQPLAEQKAKKYIDAITNEARRQLLSYNLAKNYFLKEEFELALQYYEIAGIANLSNKEMADAKFEKAVCYFNLKMYSQAKPLMEEVSQLTNTKYHLAANYYFGLICFTDQQYDQALQAFKIAQEGDDYKLVVPYYIAEILYFQKKYDEALLFINKLLETGEAVHYRKELNLLVGKLYFEKKEYKKALSLLEEYVNNNEKISNEILYELNYCYYQDKQFDKAIEGFTQLSKEKDSLGNNSMFMLGECFIRTNQKDKARNAFRQTAANKYNNKQQELSRFNYAKLSYELGYPDTALKAIKSYLDDYTASDEGLEAQEILVSLLTNNGDFAGALKIYETFKQPSAVMQKIYPVILYGRAVELVNDQQLDNADSLLMKLLDMPVSAMTPYANYWRGEIAYRNKSYDFAIRYLSFYQQANPPALGEANAVNATYDLGYCWLQKENYKKALDLFEQITKKVSPVSSFVEQDAFIRSADCYFMLKEFSIAGAMYDTAINNALPQSDYAIFQKAMVAGIKNSVDKIEILNNLTHLYPESNMVADANMEIANTYIADEKFSDAIPYLAKVLNDPDAGGLMPGTYLKLGLSYYNIDKNKEALQNYLALLDQFPLSPEADQAQDNIKNIYVESGKPNEFIDLMKKSGKDIEITEADSLNYTAAEKKYAAKDLKGATIGFTNYLDQFPDGAFTLDAYYLRSDCYDKNKDWQNALAGYEYVNSKGLNRYFERATREAARISYFEIKDYNKARKYFASLLAGSVNKDDQLEALRGIVRCYNQLKDFATATESAQELLNKKGISTDDKAIALLVLGKSQQADNNYIGAINSFKSLAAINKTAWGAEARYEMAYCQLRTGNLAMAEKSAMAAIKETAAFDNWVTKSYILLGDIFLQQKDYFNAKATYESVAKNSGLPDLKNEAQEKFNKAVEEEKANTKSN